MVGELLLVHIINTLVGAHLIAVLVSTVATREDVVVPKCGSHCIEKVTDLLLMHRLSVYQWNDIV